MAKETFATEDVWKIGFINNAWTKTYDWNNNDDMLYVYRNSITKEQRPLTEEQYRDNNYTINTGE